MSFIQVRNFLSSRSNIFYSDRWRWHEVESMGYPARFHPSDLRQQPFWGRCNDDPEPPICWTFNRSRKAGHISFFQVINADLLSSYDDTVRLFDVRDLSTALNSADVGGGAWRVKWHPSSSRKHDVLVACMHDGFKVFRFDLSGERSASMLKRQEGHDSLAYGIDWCYAPPSISSDETVVGCCSFYDHKMSIWSAWQRGRPRKMSSMCSIHVEH